jgi:hypothetical protein
VRYRLDPVGSEISAVVRPAVGRRVQLSASISGAVEVPSSAPGPVAATGILHVAVDDTMVDLDVATTRPELDVGRDGELLLRGSAQRPAGAFGLAGPPMLNPTVVLRWRAALVAEVAPESVDG